MFVIKGKWEDVCFILLLAMMKSRRFPSLLPAWVPACGSPSVGAEESIKAGDTW